LIGTLHERNIHYVLSYNHSLQPTILNDNVSQFKVGLESDKGYFKLKVKTFMSHFFYKEISIYLSNISGVYLNFSSKLALKSRL
jgi:hypothetical protein